MNKRRGLSTKISSNDQSLIKYVFYNYDQAQIEKLGFEIRIAQRYASGCKIGQILYKDIYNQSILSQSQSLNIIGKQQTKTTMKFFDTGSVDKISENLEKIQTSEKEYYTVKKSIKKKAVLQLFDLRLCEHIPDQCTLERLLNQQSKLEDNKQKKKRKKQKVDPIYCKFCKQRLYYFYLPQQKSIKFKQIQNQLQIYQNEMIQNIQWSVTLSQTFTKNTQIAKYEDKDFRLGENGKITYLVNWNNVQNASQKLQILRYRPVFCQHQKIQMNICQYCFEEVDPFELNLKKYLFQMEQKDEFKRQMVTTGSVLTQQQDQFVDNLLKNQRGILILDLDNTVLHSIQLGQIPKHRLEQMEDFYELMMGQMLNFNNAIVTTCFIVKMRPYFKEFIQSVVQDYEVYIYTKGTRIYAEEICRAVRNQYASKLQFTHNKNQKINYFEFLQNKNAFKYNRIITRDQDPNLQKKSLDNILPTRQQNLMVMDDLSTVWNYSSTLLYTVPYHYFFKKKHLNICQQKMDKVRSNNETLNQSNEGPQLESQLNSSSQKIEPVLQLPCDHFQRQLDDIQKDVDEGIIQPVKQLPCDHFQRQLAQIEKNQDQIVLDNGKKIEELDYQTQVIELKKGLAPEDKQYDYDIFPRKDFYLIFAARNLSQIHKRYFQQKKNTFSNESKKNSFAQMHKKYKSQLLEGINIKFCMKNDTKINIYGRAIKLGCKVFDNSIQSLPQYIIRLNNFNDNIKRMCFKKQEQVQKKQLFNQVQQIQKQTIKQLKYYSQTLKVPIVSESWIDFCYSYTYKFPVQPFILSDDQIFLNIQQETFEYIIEEHALKLLEKIKERNKNIENLKSEN